MSVLETSIGVALRALLEAAEPQATPHLIGLSGPQGSGKSTACRYLSDKFGKELFFISLDDFYLPISERIQLEETINPMLRVRGAPGTHDLEFLNQILDRLIDPISSLPISIPVFDKKSDDRAKSDEWAEVTKRPKIVILEGWCMGAHARGAFCDKTPINEVEKHPDAQGWLDYQKRQLLGPYQDLWNRVDKFVHIQASSFDDVMAWRTQQEEANHGITHGELSIERREWVADFIQHYQRVTEAMMCGSREAGDVIKIGKDRQVMSVEKFI